MTTTTTTPPAPPAKIVVNGFCLREAINKTARKLKLLRKRFPEVLTSFEGEIKTAPSVIVKKIEELSARMTRLKLAQQHYNCFTLVKCAGTHTNIAKALYLMSTATEIETLWNSASLESDDSRYYTHVSRERNKDTIVATRAISVDDAAARAEEKRDEIVKLRSAIATANAVELTLPDGYLEPEDL